MKILKKICSQYFLIKVERGEILKRFLIAYCLLSTCLLFMQWSIIDQQEKPLLVYHDYYIVEDVATYFKLPVNIFIGEE